MLWFQYSVADVSKFIIADFSILFVICFKILFRHLEISNKKAQIRFMQKFNIYTLIYDLSNNCKITLQNLIVHLQIETDCNNSKIRHKSLGRIAEEIHVPLVYIRMVIIVRVNLKFCCLYLKVNTWVSITFTWSWKNVTFLWKIWHFSLKSSICHITVSHLLNTTFQ